MPPKASFLVFARACCVGSGRVWSSPTIALQITLALTFVEGELLWVGCVTYGHAPCWLVTVRATPQNNASNPHVVGGSWDF